MEISAEVTIKLCGGIAVKKLQRGQRADKKDAAGIGESVGVVIHVF